MNDKYASTQPAVHPDDIEWSFMDGQPSIVAHIPDGEGNYSVVRLDQTAPESLYERQMVRALLAIADRIMDDTTPVNAVGANR